MTIHREDCLSGAPCFCTLPDEITGVERDWLGPEDETKHLVYKGQSTCNEQQWFFTSDWLTLEEYSEFSVRLFDPKARSLSWISKTLAILPKSKLRAIYNLIGAYLDEQK